MCSPALLWMVMMAWCSCHLDDVTHLKGLTCHVAMAGAHSGGTAGDMALACCCHCGRCVCGCAKVGVGVDDISGWWWS